MTSREDNIAAFIGVMDRLFSEDGPVPARAGPQVASRDAPVAVQPPGPSWAQMAAPAASTSPLPFTGVPGTQYRMPDGNFMVADNRGVLRPVQPRSKRTVTNTQSRKESETTSQKRARMLSNAEDRLKKFKDGEQYAALVRLVTERRRLIAEAAVLTEEQPEARTVPIMALSRELVNYLATYQSLQARVILLREEPEFSGLNQQIPFTRDANLFIEKVRNLRDEFLTVQRVSADAEAPVAAPVPDQDEEELSF